jgi:hypothetical protein
MEYAKSSIAVAHVPVYVYLWIWKSHVLLERRLLDEREPVIIHCSEFLIRFRVHRQCRDSVEEDSLLHASWVINAEFVCYACSSIVCANQEALVT